MNPKNSTRQQGFGKSLKVMATVAGCVAVAIATGMVTGAFSGFIDQTSVPVTAELSKAQAHAAAPDTPPSRTENKPAPIDRRLAQAPAIEMPVAPALPGSAQPGTEPDATESAATETMADETGSQIMAFAADSSDEAATDSAGEPEEETIFLTIIGDQTFVTRGPASSRPPTVAQLQNQPSAGSIAEIDSVPGVNSGSVRNSTAVPVRNTAPQTPITSDGYQQPPVANNNPAPRNPVNRSPATSPENNLSNGAAAPDDTLEIVDNRPWPTSSCPWTLAAGSDNETAQFMMQQYGCKYLSTCKIEDGSCTYYYMGS